MKRIVWDKNKNQINLRKHKISFKEASTVFFDSMSITVSDPDHSWYAFRFVTIGETEAGKLTVVFHTETEREIRIFSARKPTRTERQNYE